PRELRRRHPALPPLLLRRDDERRRAARRDDAACDRRRLGGLRPRRGRLRDRPRLRRRVRNGLAQRRRPVREPEVPRLAGRGGGDGARSIPFRVRTDGSEDELRPISQELIEPGELLGHDLSGGGGYGPPEEREPELVRQDVLARFVSYARAREVYRVAFRRDV